ncbi:MAG TPA: hypothetical protein VFN91_13005, partial [Myxococcaceae bacterium]|nr:hypothetical protein [Myxococcaceae bacterium]
MADPLAATLVAVLLDVLEYASAARSSSAPSRVGLGRLAARWPILSLRRAASSLSCSTSWST